MNACQQLIVERLVIKVSEMYGIEPADLSGKSQKTTPCIARSIVWTFTHRELGLSYRKIGKAFNRDHKSIHHGVKVTRGEITVNKERNNHYCSLTAILNETLNEPSCRTAFPQLKEKAL